MNKELYLDSERVFCFTNYETIILYAALNYAIKAASANNDNENKVRFIQTQAKLEEYMSQDCACVAKMVCY